VRWPYGEGQEMAPKAVFSEGRALRVRMGRPYEGRGIPLAPDAYANTRWPTGDVPVRSLVAFCGRAEPAPPGGGPSEVRWPYWEGQEMMPKAIFSEGRALRVRMGRPYEGRGIPLAPDAYANTRWPTGDVPVRSPVRPCGRAEPAPPPGSSGNKNCLPDHIGESAKGVFRGGVSSRTPWDRKGHTYPEGQ